MTLANVSLISLIPLIALALRMISASTAEFAYVVLAVYALFGRAPAIQAMALSWLFTMLNSGVFPSGGASSIGRYIVLAAAALSVLRVTAFTRRRRRFDLMVLYTLILGVFLVVHSFLFSAIVDVSVLKAVSWTMAMATLIAAWVGLPPDGRELIVSRIFFGLVVVMLLSLPLLGLGVGYRVNDTGFQGILNHPQAFGSTMALLGAWAASRVFSQRHAPWMTIGLVVSCLILVVLSEARTGGLALVLGVGIAVALTPIMSGRSIRAVLPGLLNRRAYAVLGLALAAALLFGPELSERLATFVNKRNEATDLVEAFETSRGGLVARMWQNIEERPLQGIGFGIASEPEKMVVQRDPLLGLPTGAVVEKGVMVIAVLEEVGLFGFLAVMGWILVLLRRSGQGEMAPFAVCTTALLLNFGESTLFSPGGMGLLSLVLLGWSAASHDMRVRRG